MHSSKKRYGVLTLCPEGLRFRDFDSEQNKQAPTLQELCHHTYLGQVNGANNDLQPHSKSDTCGEMGTKNHPHH